MPDHEIGTRDEWHAARAELARLEAEHAQLGQELADQRRRLPWVAVEKDYEFHTADGEKTLAELFDGRSQPARLQRDVRARLRARSLPRLFQLGRRARRDARASQPPRRDADLLLARAHRSAHDLQGADGLAVSLRLDLRDGVSVRFRARPYTRRGRAEAGGQGHHRRSTGVVDG